MALLADARSVLTGAHYDTWLWQRKDDMVLCFEDDSIIGFVHEFANAASLLSEWAEREAAVLTNYAPNLRASGQKAWNVYSIFLTEERCNRQTARAVMRIDENFEGTRKIARPHVTSAPMVIRALLPLLPIQARIALDATNTMSLFRERLHAAIPPKLADATLRKASLDEIIAIALDGSP